VEGSCEEGNEPSGSIKRWEDLAWLHNLQLLKKASAPRVILIINKLTYRLHLFSDTKGKICSEGLLHYNQNHVLPQYEDLLLQSQSHFTTDDFIGTDIFLGSWLNFWCDCLYAMIL
jgi:hypothetical protein